MILAGCGGGDEAETTTSGSASTPTSTASTELQFDQVEGFTLDYLEGQAAGEACKELAWVEEEAQKEELAPFVGAKATEVLACDDFPFVAYLEYEDAAAAEEGLAPALLPYLMATDTTVVMPLVGLDEATASGYLEALEAECACGEIVQPAQ